MSAYKMFSGGNKSGSSADGGANTNDLMGNAMKVYKMFSGGKGTSSTGASGGGLFDNIGLFVLFVLLKIQIQYFIFF